MSCGSSLEGWRFIPHSYSIVNQFQCLEMLKRPELEIFHQDVPYFARHWQSTAGTYFTVSCPYVGLSWVY